MIYNFFNFLNNILFYEVFGFPLLILWLFFTSIYISFKLMFPAERLLKYGIIKAIKNQYSEKDKGTITPKQALFSSISGTVGMGTIAGTSIAIKLGGPGAVIWMIVSVIFSMNTVFLESFLSHKYRTIKGNKISGGPYYYLKNGLKSIGWKKLGFILSSIYIYIYLFSSFGTGIFQVNQAIDLLTNYKIFNNSKIFLCLIYISMVFFSIKNDSKFIAKIIDTLIPLMTLIYFLSSIIIIIYNYKNIYPSLIIIFKDAFKTKTIFSGFLGTVCIGIKRASFANEAGLGTSSSSHSMAKTKDSIVEASIGSLSPIINTLCFCVLTSLVVIVTSAYKQDFEGILITKYAFNTVSEYYSIILSICVFLFVSSNIITRAFYGKKSFNILTKYKYTYIYIFLYCFFIFISIFFDLNSVLLIVDTLTFLLSIPNLIGLLFMCNIVKNELKFYYKNVKKIV